MLNIDFEDLAIDQEGKTNSAPVIVQLVPHSMAHCEAYGFSHIVPEGVRTHLSPNPIVGPVIGFPYLKLEGRLYLAPYSDQRVFASVIPLASYSVHRDAILPDGIPILQTPLQHPVPRIEVPSVALEVGDSGKA